METTNATQSEKKIIITTAPIKIEHLKEYFEQGNLKFVIEYENSELKGTRLLSYLSNLDLDCDISMKDSNFESKSELLKSYMETKNLLQIDALRLNLAMILLEEKGINTSQLFINPMFSNEEIKKFNQDNKELLIKWITFLDSTCMLFITSYKEINEKYKIEQHCEVIDDINYIGLNIVNLFSLPGFMEYYYSAPKVAKLYYFKQQFSEYMFRGKNLFSYFCVPDNTLFVLFESLLSGKMSMDLFKQFMNEEISDEQRST